MASGFLTFFHDIPCALPQGIAPVDQSCGFAQRPYLLTTLLYASSQRPLTRSIQRAISLPI